jgi:hypothetical protein
MKTESRQKIARHVLLAYQLLDSARHELILARNESWAENDRDVGSFAKEKSNIIRTILDEIDEDDDDILAWAISNSGIKDTKDGIDCPACHLKLRIRYRVVDHNLNGEQVCHSVPELVESSLLKNLTNIPMFPLKNTKVEGE